MVSLSPWPFISSVSSFSMLISVYSFLKGVGTLLELVLSFTGLCLISFQWWRDVVRESTHQGNHTKEVCKGLTRGFLMFILSEVMFFFSFFFSYLFLALAPDVEVGCSWPPVGIQCVSFMSIPLGNTVLLLSSGVSVTWAHYALMCSNKKDSTLGVGLTVLLGMGFLVLQCLEYFESKFTMADSAYGSLFYIMTGFHGLHVIIGTIFLAIVLVRLLYNHFSSSHHLGFEFSAWYWHFVDVVWLLLFLIVYWWGSN